MGKKMSILHPFICIIKDYTSKDYKQYTASVSTFGELQVFLLYLLSTLMLPHLTQCISNVPPGWRVCTSKGTG